MKTRFPKSRVVATLFGIYAAVIFAATVDEYLSGPPTDGWCRSCGGFSWADETPEVSLALALSWEILAVGGTLLMWIRPRPGYFLAGLGYQLYMTLTLVDFFASPWASRDLEASGWALRFFALPVWLFWLCVKDEPVPTPAASSPARRGSPALQGPGLPVRSSRSA